MILLLIAFGLLGMHAVVDGLLQLGGCGDRYGAEYKTRNIVQVLIGLTIVISIFVGANI